jgi:predicted ATPase
LFTDIEASTRLWEEHEGEMAVALARHDELLRDVIGGRGGYVFSTAGDAFAATFSTAADAVDAAVEAQRVLRSERWPEAVSLSVRMGLHSGVSHERDGDYFGPAVNRTARLMSAAHGGQVVASAATIAQLPQDRFRVGDLGRHRLADLLEPEHVFQIEIDGDGDAYLPLSTLDAVEHNLPVLRSSFYARGAELDAVESLLNTGGVVTLTGFGGVGKTRLALEVAARLSADHDAVLLVDLAPIAEPELVVSATAATLGIGAGEVAGDSSAVVRALQARRTLLVFDNCEHLVDPVAELVGLIAESCATCTVLATSREPLGVDGERVWRVRSMELDTARALFEDRARAVRPGLVIGPNEAKAVEEICTRLDGIPLALELAAARAEHLSVQEIAGLLDQRFQLLSGGRRRARQRQQTLQATMDWSYGLLRSEEQQTLRCCAVFVGGFTLEGLAGVLGEPAGVVLDLLGSLVAKSLVIAEIQDDGSSRYRLLETVRQYALERLIDQREARSVRERHARCYRDQLDDLARDVARRRATTGFVDLGGRTVDHSRRQADLPNFLATLDWFDEQHDLVELGRFVAGMVPYIELYVWVDDANRYLGRADVEAVLEGQSLAAYVLATAINANALGQFNNQLELAARAHTLATPGSDIRLIAASYLANALAVFNPDAGLALIDETLTEFTPATEWYRAGLLGRRVDCYVTSGRLERGVQAAYELLELPGMSDAQRSMFGSDVALVLHVLGRDEDVGTRLDVVDARSGLERHERLLFLSLAAAGQGHPDQALQHLCDAARNARRSPARLFDRDLLIAAAALAFLRGDTHRASVLLAVERQRLFARSPGTWALYVHYRDQTRQALTREELDTCKTEARDLTTDQALAQELGDAWEPK